MRGAKRLEIRLYSTAREANLTLADDGIGFDADSTPFGHFGLVGMRERADEIGAELNVVSAPGNGTSVQIRLPLIGRGGATKGRLEEFSQAAKELD